MKMCKNGTQGLLGTLLFDDSNKPFKWAVQTNDLQNWFGLLCQKYLTDASCQPAMDLNYVF